MIQKLYPNGKRKACNFSYDDGVLQDVRFVEMLNHYGLKGTFNLNSGLMKEEFAWHHESGRTIRRLSETVVSSLYQGHEVASHTCTHPYMSSLSKGEILGQMGADRFFLEQLLNKEVRGFAVPFHFYSPVIAACAQEVGFEYARISEESGNYCLPENPYWWRGGKFHWSDDLEQYVENFLRTETELAVCQLVGHSYDLDVMNMWDQIEHIMQLLADDSDVCPMTNLEIARYRSAMEQIHITPDEIRNPSSLELWFQVQDKVICLKPGTYFNRKEN